MYDDMLSRFDTIPECDRRTDGRCVQVNADNDTSKQQKSQKVMLPSKMPLSNIIIFCDF